MSGMESRIEPRPVPPVDTRYRRIQTAIPAPQSVPILESLLKNEPVSMQGQPPIVWDRAEGFQVYDAWGNMWLDWSSGVLVANSGHSNAQIVAAIVAEAQHGLLHSYCFPNAIRAQLAEALLKISPTQLTRVFLLTTGGETTENAIKLARTYGQKVGGPRKINFVSFDRAFHGRTLGSQLAGGIPGLKTWIGNIDPGFIQAPFPDGFRTKDVSFELFEQTLRDRQIDPDTVCGVMMESYQGGGASFAPREYVQALRRWCDRHDALLIMDEVQAGFGRTGKMFAFEHYAIVPDLICAAKGLSGSLPLSAVIGREDVMNLYGPGEMTSTHSGNPICAAAALANLKYMVENHLVEQAARVGEVFQAELSAIHEDYPQVIAAHHGKGLVAGLHVVQPGTETPDGDLAGRTVMHAVEKGLMMFAPVGTGGATLKAAPPLVITADAIRDGAAVLREALEEALHE
jgi:4-aminobutyrate aminotransferase / (S)-3-amino-2-methylpropionate transaminase / 5-aminovalerate transaminase